MGNYNAVKAITHILKKINSKKSKWILIESVALMKHQMALKINAIN
jgi:hypothetical protein